MIDSQNIKMPVSLMKYTSTPFKFLLSITFLLSSTISDALDSKSIEQQANNSIKKLYHTLKTSQNLSMSSRIEYFSKQFLGTPYKLGALGEGPDARYDQFPQYRIDGFDCDTYVNTILALATADSLESFKQCLKFTRYKDGKITYMNRNHFTSIDWNTNNQQRGLLKDITLTITDKQKKPLALYAKAMINKPGWYQHKTINTIRLQQSDAHEQLNRLNELKLKGSTLQPTLSTIPYIPLTALFSNNGTPNLDVFSQIPHASIIEIIRPNWDLNQQIGTSLNVSHLGFAFWIKGILYFREASSQEGQVVDVPLIDYLKNAQKSPTIKGINIQIVLPLQPKNHNCSHFINS